MVVFGCKYRLALIDERISSYISFFHLSRMTMARVVNLLQPEGLQTMFIYY
jgi:hypothetical protein